MAVSDHNLEARGTAFYNAVVGDAAIDAASEALVVEAARMADRLEQLNDTIAGKGVVNLMHLRHMHPSDDTQITMIVDNVMAEARQLQTAFERISRPMLKRVEANAAPVKVDISDDIAARRAARRSAAG